MKKILNFIFFIKIGKTVCSANDAVGSAFAAAFKLMKIMLWFAHNHIYCIIFVTKCPKELLNLFVVAVLNWSNNLTCASMDTALVDNDVDKIFDLCKKQYKAQYLYTSSEYHCDSQLYNIQPINLRT
jgi:hypothetical protein